MIIRPVIKKDFVTIKDIYEYYVKNSAATFETESPSIDELINRWKEHSHLPYLVAIQNEEVLGYAYISPYHKRHAYRYTVEDSIYIRSGYTKKGIGYKLLMQLILESKKINMQQIIARISVCEGYEGSIKLHEKLGFVHKGCLTNVGYKFEKFIDTVIMQKGLF